MSPQYRLYYSPRCPNCTRFAGAVVRLPELSKQLEAVNVDVVHGAADHVTAVPTIMTADGTTHVGSKAFEWLSQFQAEAELECFQLQGGCRGSLAWSSLDDPNALGMFSETFSAFEPPTD